MPVDQGLSPIIQFAYARWRLAAKLTGGLALLGLVFYFAVVPYSITTNIQINDAQTSQLQAFTNNFFALSKTQATNARKTQTPSQSAADYLDRQDIYTDFVHFLVTDSAEAQAGFAALENKLGDKLSNPALNLRAASATLRRMVKFSSSNPTEVAITTYAGTRDLAYFLNSEYSRFTIDELKKHEDHEVEQIRTAIERQRDFFREQFAIKNKELIAFQRRPENVLSLATGPNVGNYISDLLVRKNELQLKISENERTIQYLGGAKAAELAHARNLGGRSQAQQLSEENGLLRKQVAALDESVRKFTGATNGAAEAMHMQEELQKMSDREFHNFQEANDLLSKLAVYSVSIAGKFELEHVPEFEDVKKAASLYLVLAVAVFLAQVTFAGVVYQAWTKEARAEAPAPPAPLRARDALPREVTALKVKDSALKVFDVADAIFLNEKPVANETPRGLH
jgi:hypothetical protein